MGAQRKIAGERSLQQPQYLTLINNKLHLSKDKVVKEVGAVDEAEEGMEAVVEVVEEIGVAAEEEATKVVALFLGRTPEAVDVLHPERHEVEEA